MLLSPSPTPGSDAVTSPDAVTRTLAMLAIVIALGSLVWNVVAWRLGGARVKVDLWVTRDSQSTTTREVVAQVSNRGRHQVQLTTAILEYSPMAPDAETVWLNDPAQPRNSMLAPGAMLQRYTNLIESDPSWIAEWYRASIQLASGKTVRSKKEKVGPPQRI